MYNTLKNISIFILITMSINIGLSQNQQLPGFDELLGQSLKKIQDTVNRRDLPSCVGELKRINAMYPDNWLSYYYTALFNIQYSLQNLSSPNEDVLKETKSIIDRLSERADIDRSEILTLNGYYYNVLVAQDPAKNGQIYFKEIIASYQKAISLNADNPRPRLMLLIFRENMAKMTGAKNDGMCDELSTIKELFGAKPENKLYPSWGESTALQMIAQNCRQNEQ